LFLEGKEGIVTMTKLRVISQYAIILILLILTFAIAHKTNGLNVTINFFYISVILGARFWGLPGGIAVGLVAGILGGPFLPDNITEGFAQPTSQWLSRLGFYVLIGAFVGKLFSELKHKNKELVKKTEQVKQSYIELIDALAEAMEMRDSYTHGHCRRVSKLSVRIGKRMGLGQRELSNLKKASILHDIGKIGIPEEILNKEGELTPYEYEVMKQHPALGAKILSGIPQAAGIIEGVLHHHERMDGRGYPDGLMGEDIGLQARIIAVCDTWDALTTKRAYREAMSYDEALIIMESGRGTQFDPTILDYFLEIIEVDRKRME